jgi:hypothetical protein
MIIKNSIKILLLLLILIIYKYKTIKYNPIDTTPYDIIYNTGGYYGFYQLGICHYIKNNFNYKNKSVLGISAGAWLSIFMALDHSKSNEMLRQIFQKNNFNDPMYKISNIIKDVLHDNSNDDFYISNINIAVTELYTRKIKIHNKFLSIDELTRCATASSFVPYITQNNAISFYKHKLIFDGGFLKKRYFKNIDTDKTLSITFNMFNRFKPYPLFSFIKPKRSLYELYILGYQDALKNRSYLEKYLIPL